MIYFIQAENGGPIKIGYTNNVERRLSELQEGNPYELVVLKTIEGPIKLEKALHRRFESCRFRIEWFYPTVELVDFIENINTPKHQLWILDTLKSIKREEDSLNAPKRDELRFLQESLSFLHSIMDGFTPETAVEWLKARYREDLRGLGYNSFKAEECLLERLFILKDEVSKLWEFSRYWEPQFVTTSVNDNRSYIKVHIYKKYGVDVDAHKKVACS